MTRAENLEKSMRGYRRSISILGYDYHLEWYVDLVESGTFLIANVYEADRTTLVGKFPLRIRYETERVPTKDYHVLLQQIEDRLIGMTTNPASSEPPMKFEL